MKAAERGDVIVLVRNRKNRDKAIKTPEGGKSDRI